MLDEFHSVREQACLPAGVHGLRDGPAAQGRDADRRLVANAPTRRGRPDPGVVALVDDISERREPSAACERARNGCEWLSMPPRWESGPRMSRPESVGVDRLAPIHGLEPENSTGRSAATRHSSIRTTGRSVLGSIEAALEGEAGYDIEFRVVWPDGTVALDLGASAGGDRRSGKRTWWGSAGT